MNNATLSDAVSFRATNLDVVFKKFSPHNYRGPATIERKVVRLVKPYRGFRTRSSTTASGDIAVLQIDEPIEFDQLYISPICLPPTSNFSFDPNSCLVAGLGEVDFDNGIKLTILILKIFFQLINLAIHRRNGII